MEKCYECEAPATRWDNRSARWRDIIWTDITGKSSSPKTAFREIGKETTKAAKMPWPSLKRNLKSGEFDIDSQDHVWDIRELIGS